MFVVVSPTMLSPPSAFADATTPVVGQKAWRQVGHVADFEKARHNPPISMPFQAGSPGLTQDFVGQARRIPLGRVV
jgi:hypothetical protein